MRHSRVVWSNDRLQVVDFDGRDVGGVDQRQWPVGGLEYLIVAHDGGPLQGQANVLLLVFVKASVHAMLEIGRR